MAQKRKQLSGIARNNCLRSLALMGTSRKLLFCVGGDYFDQMTPRRQVSLFIYLFLSVFTKRSVARGS